jgi:uncharacterized membrane protein YdjX (TVP38/TMEM64 family)
MDARLLVLSALRRAVATAYRPPMSQTSEPCLAAATTATPPSLFQRSYRFISRLGRVGPLALAASILPGVTSLALYGRLGAIAPWLRDHPLVGPFVCAGTFAAAGGVALVPTYALSALCGWCFGFPIGLTATLSGFLAAALVGYLIGRAADGGRTLAAVSDMPKWRAIGAALACGGFGKKVLVISLVRLAPVAPFSLTNLCMAAAQVSPLPYAIGTVCGMLPRTAILMFAASRLSSVDAPLAQEPWLIAAGVLATVAVVITLGWIAKNGLAQITSEDVR